MPSPSSTSVRTPSAALITVRGQRTSPTFRCRSGTAGNAPAKPTDRTCTGFTSRMIASVAQRADWLPIPPQISAEFSFSNKRYRRPSCSIARTVQFRTSGAISRSMAAMMAILLGMAVGVSVCFKPLHRPAQSRVHWNRSPAQFTFCFRRTYEHHFSSHAHGVNGCARFLTKQPAGYHLVDNPGREREKIRQLHGWRLQPCDHCQPIQNLFQRKIFAAQNVALARSSFFQRLNVTAGALGSVDQVQSRLDVCRELALEKINDNATGWRRFNITLPNRCRRIHDHNIDSRSSRVDCNLLSHELRTLIVSNHVRK